MLNLAKLARNVLFEVTNPPNPIIFLIEDPFHRYPRFSERYKWSSFLIFLAILNEDSSPCL